MNNDEKKGLAFSVLFHIVCCALVGLLVLTNFHTFPEEPVYDVALVGGGDAAPEVAQPEPEPEPEIKTMYTTYDLAFRAEAKKDSEKLGAVPVNTEVKVLDTSKDYYKIEYKGKQGYVLGEYLTEDKKVAEQAAKDAAAQAAQQQKNTGGNGGGGGGKKNKECLTGGVLN